MFAAADVLQVIRDSDFSATQARAYAVTGHGRMEGEQFDLRRRVEGWSNPHSGKADPEGIAALLRPRRHGERLSGRAQMLC